MRLKKVTRGDLALTVICLIILGVYSYAAAIRIENLKERLRFETQALETLSSHLK